MRPTTNYDEIILHDVDRAENDLERLSYLDGEYERREKYRMESNTGSLLSVFLY